MWPDWSTVVRDVLVVLATAVMAVLGGVLAWSGAAAVFGVTDAAKKVVGAMK